MTKRILLATAACLPALASSSFHGSRSAFLPSSLFASPNLARRRRTDAVPTLALAAQPGKGDLYNDEELFDLLNLHESLNPAEEKGMFSGDIGGDNGDLNEESISGGIHDWVLQTLNEDDGADAKSNPSNGMGQSGDPTEASAIPGFHEMVLEAIEDINSASSPPKAEEENPSINQLAYDNLQTLLRDKKPSIRAIATDVDGTLLSGQYLHPRTQEAILKAIDQAYTSTEKQKIQHFFPATGKSRKGAEISLGPIIGPLLYQCPGVYIQGLYCVDKEGNVVFEKKLSASAVWAAEALVAEFGISIVGYDGDDLYTTEQTDVVISLSEYYGEPTVQLIADEGTDSVIKLADHEPGIHKLLLMDNDLEKLALFRPKLEELAKRNGATVTQAIPTMLELLPAGCSKADGVERLCEALGVDGATELLALGDAENDAGMLESAAIGIAVGNACPRAMDAADFIMRERHDEGAAGLAMNLFGFDV
eukprot:CAMPEP_0202007956 /NCGR_PEP_ID=MMETSP0905-20130828/12296_1 /ASSEMBLY_ACC=CAM_ASM_000554 /TAXON_ID=420261 /ORGANISM="Thalassiosira antarctica, Strain CCMP982" /LENGTH=478 /DNA_ID=CAMNT_0048565999 /DNA_START=16 /DNA_END=1452 /DNA_ORIENTATION=-